MYTLIIPALGRWRQKNCEFKASLGDTYINTNSSKLMDIRELLAGLCPIWTLVKQITRASSWFSVQVVLRGHSDRLSCHPEAVRWLCSPGNLLCQRPG